MKMDDLIYLILKRLDKARDEGNFNWKEISHDTYNVSLEKWSKTISYMLDAGLVDGFIELPIMGQLHEGIKPNNPRITLRGIQYLKENTPSGKVVQFLKMLKDTIPGL